MSALLFLTLALTACGGDGGASSEPAPDDPAPVRILALGDSTTYGSTSHTEATPGGYRGELDRLLDRAGVAHVFVGTATGNPPVSPAQGSDFAHDGWPGARVEELDAGLLGRSRFDGGHWLDGVEGRDPVRPDVVVVMAGTNDVVQGFDVAHLLDRLRHLVDTVRAHVPSVRLVVCTIAPQADPAAAAYNAAIRTDLVPSLRADGVPVAVADVEAALLAQPDTLGADGIHPTASGYRLVAGAIAAAVEQVAGQ